MPTIAIVGAGPGLGASIAKTFGGHGFQVALIARSKDKLEALAAELGESGISAAGFPADVSDRLALSTALGNAAAQFGTIDVLEFSPYGGLVPVYPQEMTVDNLRPQIEESLYGAVTAVNAVLPAMIEAGTGTLLFTTGGGAINPYPMLATTNAAHAALRNWVFNLNGVLADKGIHAANVAINVFIGAQPPSEGIPYAAPDDLAQIYWNLHVDRDQAEVVVTG
ncbi:SDR family NAD(P)-dependent oxidoreductase [Phytohabitans rumicis]|uniref:Short-chain dehydrogenase n=1 Tax=Phytohabitans rumicis TaxID=1076125 RepID=A0A6V8KXI2_9ACTN|nr:SDR family NAD(P)-dependent oxidoreductase [Phytohabitans rumicis]GFJ87019.1 short-chain dehydrogenase [Phytohabitans rumicis]